MQKTTVLRGLLGGVLASALSLSATAAVTTEHERIDESQWRYRVTPYLWGAGLEGEVGKFSRRADVSKNFSDVLEGLDAGAMLAFEARRGRYGVLTDLLYVSLSESGRIPTPVGIEVDAQAKVKAATFMLAGQYRAIDNDHGYMDVVGGARYWGLQTDINVSLGNLFSVDGRDEESWIDPIVGIKGTYHLGERTYFTGWAMIGGFDVGSRFSSDLMGALGYKLTDRSALLLAYRRLAVDYTSSDFAFDAALQGPAMGWDYRF
ncbi:hypothetical protein [Halopseudomonas salina]|uniref:Outer membrane protein beta-barrel domain-containing protein n=1 Tax=Halopseudomonas salina TaxID=1323744 RepID=A0ABQ1PEM2_9GAMM|nr:hypothetical protein [Halopseudomonas salina]GGC95677.1 hypothetical protein GCM10007418_14010 [Halopseudomonas salina]